MNKSDTIGKLAAALSKVHGETHDVFKDKKGFNYKYADLSSVLDITRPLCAKHELAITQLCCTSADRTDVMGVTTVLMHSSGEWVESTIFMPVHETKGMTAAQAAGCVITYARRYALAAILGIAQTDDDAAGVPTTAPTQQPIVTPGIKTRSVAPATVTQAVLAALMRELQVADEESNVWLAKANCSNIAQLSELQAAKLIAILQTRKNTKLQGDTNVTGTK